MSPGFAGLNPCGGGGGLEFVDELKRDISSYLLQNPEDEPENDLLDCLLNKGVLCYACPDDCSEDRWRDARADAWANGTAPEEANGAPFSAPASAPSSADAGMCQGGRLTGYTPSAASSAAPPRPAVFGAPPWSSSIRWPLRPQEQSRGLGGLGQLFRNGRSPYRGGAGDSDESGSVESCDSEARTRHSRASGFHAPTHVGERQSVHCGLGAGKDPHLRAPGSTMQSTMRERGRQQRGRSADPHRASSSSCSSDERPTASQVNMAELLEFTSCFESSNLQYAVYNIEDSAYDLVLENDVHTRGHTQWFYFAVRNGRPGQTARFRIVNMSKAKSLFQLGMKPLVWSESEAAQHSSLRHSRSSSGSSSAVFPPDAQPVSELWRPRGESVKYFRTKAGNTSRFHTLSFEYTFQLSGDTVFFAYCVPYTYSMLRSSLSAMALDPVSSPRCRFRTLCTTTGNVKCDVVEITNFAISKRSKKAVVVSSRVHPGECNASWLVSGLLAFLLSDSIEAQVLRDHFIWQIVPMLNPDGVISGNYRCGLTGVDLNRQWRRPHQDLHSPIYRIKKLLAAAKKKAHLCAYLDLHGHSRKCGIFSYACGNFPKDDYRRFSVRMFPKLLSMLTPEFQFAHCRWRVGKGKRGTGRVVVSKDLGLVNTYTIEASFWGAILRPKPETSKAAPVKRVGSPIGELIQEVDDKQKDKGAGSDSEGSDNEPLSPGLGEVADAERRAAQAVTSKQVIVFTPSKLEELGINLARALLLQQNLGPKVQIAMRKAQLQKEKAPVTAPVVEASVAEASRSDSGNSTPSVASEANHSESEDEAFFEPVQAAELHPQAAASSDAHEERPYLGIDVGEVMHELETNPIDSENESVSGSDSDPSEDNLAPQDLIRLYRQFSHKRKSASAPPSGQGSAGHKTHSSHNGSGRQAGEPSPTRTKADPGNTTSSRWSPAKRKSRKSQSRSDRRSPPLAHPHVEPRPTPVQRTVAFGQTTYHALTAAGKPTSPVPACLIPIRSLAASSPNLDSGSAPASPESPHWPRSFSDTQAINFCGDEKDRDRGRRRHGWSQPPLGALGASSGWPPIPVSSGRSGQGDHPLLSGSKSETCCLLGTPPKDRFAFPQSGIADARRLQGSASTGRLTLANSHARPNEDANSMTRSRTCIRNASITMLQSKQTPSTQAVQMNGIPDALLSGITSAVPPLSSAQIGSTFGSERTRSTYGAQHPGQLAQQAACSSSRPGTAMSANASSYQRAPVDTAEHDAGRCLRVEDACDPEEGPASARMFGKAESLPLPQATVLSKSAPQHGSSRTTVSLRQELLRYIRKC